MQFLTKKNLVITFWYFTPHPNLIGWGLETWFFSVGFAQFMQFLEIIFFLTCDPHPPFTTTGIGNRDMIFCADLHNHAIHNKKIISPCNPSLPSPMEWRLDDFSLQICTFHAIPSKKIFGTCPLNSNSNPMCLRSLKHSSSVQIFIFHWIPSKKFCILDLQSNSHGRGLETWQVFCADLQIACSF